jgi:hypothetical protein
MEDYKFLFKVVLIGEAGVGKLFIFVNVIQRPNYFSMLNISSMTQNSFLEKFAKIPFFV